MTIRRWSSFLTLTKIDDEQQIVEGFASSERLDSQDDVVDAAAIKAALPGYMAWANLREMHTGPDGESEQRAVGTVLSAEVIDGDVELPDGTTIHNPLHVVAKVVDADAWQKVKEGVYKGFSIGGKILKAVREQLDGKAIRRITKLLLYEISLVDRPANQDAKILMWKGIGMAPLDKAAGGGDLSKPIAAIQVARNDAEMAGDLDSAALLTQAIALLLQANGDAEDAPPVDGALAAEAGGDGAMPADGQVQMAAQPSVRKAGRALSGANMSAMQSTIRSLLQMLATAGDATAGKALALYAPAAQPGADLPDGETGQKAASAEDLVKALTPAIDGLKTELSELVKGLGARVEQLERQPAGGGPVMRADKSITGQEPAGSIQKAAKTPTDAELDNLRRLSNTEPDPVRRAEYTRKLMAAEQALAKH